MGDGPRSGGGLTGRMRVRIVAAVVLVLLLSSLVSVVLLRGLLYDRLDDEITADLRQEADEFRLRGGLDAEDGQPYSRDVTATLDAYFSREVPDEGELLLGFVDGRLHAAERAQDAPPPEELGGAIERWLSVQQEETGRLSTGAGEARYVALPLRGAPSDGVFVVANFPAYERGELDDAVRTQVLTQTWPWRLRPFWGSHSRAMSCVRSATSPRRRAASPTLISPAASRCAPPTRRRRSPSRSTTCSSASSGWS